MKRDRFCGLLGGLVLFVAAGAPSGARAAKKGGRRNGRKRSLTRKGAASELPTVQKVGGHTIRVNGKTYEVDDNTRITVNGVEAPLSRIKPGMQVQISGGVSVYGKGSRDTLYKASRIAARKNDNLQKKANQSNKRRN